jgi:septal ring factor EnvC (AmiA/AmiB activator)
MYTVAELKKQYKTLAAAKSFYNIKAKSWDALAEKLNAKSISPEPSQTDYSKETFPDRTAELQAEIDRLKTENAALKQQLVNTKSEPEYQSDYFKSAEAELIYSLVKLDGEDRMRALRVTRNHYRDAKKAKDWRNQIATKIHPDKCYHPDAQAAIAKASEIYKSMVA